MVLLNAGRLSTPVAGSTSAIVLQFAVVVSALAVHTAVGYTAAGSIPPPSGNPQPADGACVVTGSARFCVLTPHLLRLEYNPEGPVFEDNATMAIWNRQLLPVPQFTHAVDPVTGVLTIATQALNLTYFSTGSPPFSADNLLITMLEPNLANATEWSPGLSSEGNLFGTFHNLDGMSGAQDMNCSHPVNGPTTASPYAHWYCAMGVLSTHGWATIDDSRSPVFPDGGNWPVAQTRGQCEDDASLVAPPRVPCFQEPFTPLNQPLSQQTCEQVGCCWDAPTPSSLMVPLQQWFNGADNVLSSPALPPSNASNAYHSDLGIVGYALVDPAPGVDNNLLKLWHITRNRSSSNINSSNSNSGGDECGRLAVDEDYWTTGSPAEEAAAEQAGYTFVGMIGYLPVVATSNATVPVQQFYSNLRDDHYASLNDCNGCDGCNYSSGDSLGFAVPAEADTLSCFQRSGNVDLYFFGHGVGEANYAAALGDLAAIAGRVPIPRRHALGVSWSRWAQPGRGWTGNQSDMVQAVEGLAAARFPLDTFIFDMNWHLKPEWTGYTWDRSAAWYPDPEGLMAFLHEHNLSIGANLHDAEGVMPFEAAYAAMAAATGATPTTPNATVLFHISNQTYADALSGVVLEPLALGGIDFWWTDYQQELAGGGPPQIGTLDVPGLNPTAVLNHYRFHNYSRAAAAAAGAGVAGGGGGGSGRRGLVHSRFGGLGGHRYPTQFGGDVQQSWDSLAFFPYHVSTAANVLVGYWAEELMSLIGQYELFARVLQFGSWGPVFTTWGNPDEPNNLWEDSDLPEPYREAVRTTMLHRAMTIPHRYTLARIAHDTGVSIVRPAYYRYAWEADAYDTRTYQQFFVGPDILVSPVHQPCTNTSSTNSSGGGGGGVGSRNGDGSSTTASSSTTSTCTATHAVWFPGDASAWIPAFNNSPPAALPGAGALHGQQQQQQQQRRSDGAWVAPRGVDGGSSSSFVNVSSTLSQVPVFVRAGAVVAMLVDEDAVVHGSASRAFDPLVFTVYEPAAAGGGTGKGGTWVYEDDGMSNDYKRAAEGGSDAFVNISMTFAPALLSQKQTNNSCTVFNASATGSYTGSPASRQYVLHVVNPHTGGGRAAESTPPTTAAAGGEKAAAAAAAAAATTTTTSTTTVSLTTAVGSELLLRKLDGLGGAESSGELQHCKPGASVPEGTWCEVCTQRVVVAAGGEEVVLTRTELVVSLPRAPAHEARQVRVCRAA
jgi:alpha-glucosidase (family GH31 glycosyl hydrolase)